MSITINHVRENESDKTIFFTITIPEEEPIEWHGDVPLDKEPQAYLESIEDKIILLIYNRLYPDNDYKRFLIDDMTELKAMEAWLADGCRNKVQVGYYKNGKPKYEYQAIEKKLWKSTHPPEISMIDKIDRASITPDLKSVLKDIIMS